MESPDAQKGATARIVSVDALRGIAALAVCFYHFLIRPESPLSARFANTVLRHGWLGVHAFFVISGFVVPLAMYRSGYRLNKLGTFMGKRIVRLDPPYLVSIVIAIVLNRLMPGTIDQPARVDVTSTMVLGHVFYGFSHLLWQFGWLNSVYWTLEIEFQYYLAVALLVPLLVSPRRSGAPVAVGALLGLAFVGPSSLALFRWGAVFCFGFVLFMRECGLWSHRGTMLAWSLVAVVSWLTVGKAVTIVAAATTIAIATWKRPGNAVEHLGRVSYSLYLVHIPIGGRLLVYAAKTGVAGVGLFGAFALALLASFVAAYLMWRFIERPAQSLATRIGYLTQRLPETVAVGALPPAGKLPGTRKCTSRVAKPLGSSNRQTI